jgi:SpoVK/Ycf46/Vps4 family AAA+-type ATPase
MSSPIDTVRKMLLAHQSDDGGAFRGAVRELIDEERRKNHHVVARDLERLLDGGGEVRRLRPFRTLHAWENEIPKDGDRGLPLLHVLDPRRELDELVLAPELRAEVERFVREASRGELLRAHGVAPPSRLLLCGPPGCGKTSVAEAVAHAMLLPLVVVRFDVVISSYLGETAANLRKIFDFIATRPMVVLFDEFDAIAKQRDDDFEHGELKRVVNAFLQLLDGLRGDNVIIAATNHQGMLDSAVWRRFDEVLMLGLPSDGDRQRLFFLGLQGRPVSGLPDWKALVSRTAGLSHADIERIAQMAVRETLLSDHISVHPEVLLEAVVRYEARMSVVGSVVRRHVVPTAPEAPSQDAALERQSASAPSGDEGRAAGKPGAEASGRTREAGASRARAKGAARPRPRAPRGAVVERDEEEGAGGGR